MKDDDEQEENTFGVTRYPCMPSLVALQQMRNRLHLAFLGRKLMKWTALATGRELRKIAIELDSVIKGFAEEMRKAFILLARARYFCPNLNKIVLENIGQEAGVVVIPTTKTVSAVKIVQFEIAETGIPPYEHLGIEKGGQAIMDAKKAWLELLKKLIMMMQLRSSFLMVEIANKNATKKWNVLSKLVAPRVLLSIGYIVSELEEIEREDNFRLKRFKELKERKNKGNDSKKYSCTCDKKPGKGDDFTCAVCKKEEDERKLQKKTCEFKTPTCIVEVIGDKFSTFSTANQKRLDDLTAHLEKVISLTDQCKTEGLVSPSIHTFIYACKEVRCKLEELDQPKETCDTSNATEGAMCSTCEEKNPVPTSMPCNICSESKVKEEQQKPLEVKDSFGCFETKYKEIVKVKKLKNEDGTISEEKQVITVKTERKFPQNINALSSNPCCGIKSIDFSSNGAIKDNRGCVAKKSKSESMQNGVKRKQTNIKACVSDSGDYKNGSPSIPEYCKMLDASTNPKTPSVTSTEACPKKCSSTNASIKSKLSHKSSKSSNKSSRKKSRKKSKKDECCQCKVEITSVCCDSMWKDVACSTTGLSEISNEVEELCIRIKESELVKPIEELDRHSVKSKSSADRVELFCDTYEIEIKSSFPHDTESCSKSSKISSKDDSKEPQAKTHASTATSNIELKQLQQKPSSVKSQPCCKTESGLRNTAAASKTCCKIRIISKQKSGSENKEEKVQEIIFFGSILDAIKKILTASKSQDSIKKVSNDLKQQDNIPKSCSCTSRPRGLPTKKSSTKFSAKSSICKTCETASQVPSDGIDSSVYGSCKSIEKSQSCPQCHAKNEEKITWTHQRSQSEQNTCTFKPPRHISSKPVSCGNKLYKESVSKCPVCGSILSKSQSNATSLPSRSPSEAHQDSCISCNQESCSVSSVQSTVSAKKSTCKICPTDKPYRKTQPNTSQSLPRSRHSCPVCSTRDQKTSHNQEIKKADDRSCRFVPKAKSAKSLCSGYTPRSSKDESGSKEESSVSKAEIVMVDASTSTRRSDRYDVRPLKMMKFHKQPTCTCHSDSYLVERTPRNLKRSRSCSSCYGGYFSTANQKRLDDLTAHLEKVISLTDQCKTEGLVSPSIHTFIYACKEVRCKLEELDQPKETCDTSNATEGAMCSTCEEKNPVPTSMPCNICSESKVKEEQQKPLEVKDSFGCFETKYKEIVKVKKLKNEDGTISEEKQVITVKTERKFPQNINALSSNPCCGIKSIDFSSNGAIKDNRGCVAKKSKSESMQNGVKRKQTNIKACVSDSGDYKNGSPSIPEYCKMLDASTNPKTPSVTSTEACPKKCSSTNASIKSKLSHKSSKSSNKSSRKKSRKKSKKDECCQCKVEITSVCCDSMWKDVACSTTGLSEISNEVEELCIRIKESELVKPIEELDRHSVKSKSSADRVELFCDTYEIEIKSSFPHDTESCSKSSKISSKDDSKEPQAKTHASTATSNIELKQLQQKPSSVKSQPCCKTESGLRNTAAASKTCCKIRIISKQKSGSENKEEKVQEIIFFGSILDAIKKILTASKSQDSIKKVSNDLKQQDNIPKSCSCTSRPRGLPTKKSSTKFSAKSSICKTCETASQVPSDGIDSSVYGSCKSIEKSQSCPQCHAKNEEKITWTHQRSQSEQNTCTFKPPRHISSKPVSCGNKLYKESVSKCPVCGSILSKSQSNATSLPSRSPSEAHQDSCISCNQESCSVSSVQSTVSAKKSTCKICPTDKPYRKTQPNTSQSLPRSRHSCPVCSTRDQKTSHNQEIKKADDRSCRFVPKAKSAKSLCSGYTPRSSKDESGSKEESSVSKAEIVMVDASTSTRRSDRYDVRPLKMMKFHKQPTCTCHSDSYLVERTPRNLKRSRSCSSCYGGYFR